MYMSMVHGLVGSEPVFAAWSRDGGVCNLV